MKLIVSSNSKESNSELETKQIVGDFTIIGDSDVHTIEVAQGKKIFYIGNLIGIRNLDNAINEITENSLCDLFSAGVSHEVIDKLEGRFLMIFSDTTENTIEIFTDRFGQHDCYYSKNNDEIIFASDLSLFPHSPSQDGYDQVALAHTLTVYGFRPAKKHTLYKSIKRLGIGEYVLLRANETKTIEFLQEKFEPITKNNYAEADLNEYSDIFLDALKIRASDKGNVVYLSSGWDSTAILGGLVHLFGSSKVKAITGRMKYSERAGIINPFEVDRAKKVADYYGIDLNIVEFDFSKKIPVSLDNMKEAMKNNFMSSGTIFTHGALADYVAKNYNNGESIFAGEISDGAHNLGFSQFATIFHPVLEFREYSDKMASYLFGPTFQDAFINGTHEDDIIYKTLKSTAGSSLFDKASCGSEADKKKQLLASFFLRNHRLPLISKENDQILTEQGRKLYSEEMETTYLHEAAESLTQENHYAWYLHLYNSFHWQCSTVASLNLTSQVYGFNMQLPYYDSRLIEFLSSMPENWGRGLDFNPTKYPLKWMLENKIDYPMHLQVGPHSYLYDVDHSFNHSVERAHYSALTPLYKELLSNRSYHQILSPEIFNLDYIDSIVDRYVNGEEVTGKDLNVLVPFYHLVLSGWY